MRLILIIATLLVSGILVAGIANYHASPSTSNTYISLASEPQNSNNSNTTSNTIKSPLPPPTGYVNDYSNILDEATRQRLESTLSRLKERSEIEFAVVVIDTTGEQTIFDYSLAVARGWGIGPKDKNKGGGILLLVAIKDRQSRIQVSRSLKADLPDEVVLDLMHFMKESFRQGKYGEGVLKCVDAIITRLAEHRGFTINNQ